MCSISAVEFFDTLPQSRNSNPYINRIFRLRQGVEKFNCTPNTTTTKDHLLNSFPGKSVLEDSNFSTTTCPLKVPFCSFRSAWGARWLFHFEPVGLVCIGISTWEMTCWRSLRKVKHRTNGFQRNDLPPSNLIVFCFSGQYRETPPILCFGAVLVLVVLFKKNQSHEKEANTESKSSRTTDKEADVTL